MPTAEEVSSASRGEEPSQSPSSRYTHPVRLLVQARHNPGAAPPGASKPDVLLVKQALARQAEHKRRAEKWADRMMEEPVGLDGLRKGIKYVSYATYLAVIHERHLNMLCSYPACSNPPRSPYSSRKRFSISTSSRTIKPVQGNGDEGFCSRPCRIRSEWIARQLETSDSASLAGSSATMGGLVFMEDLEARGEVDLEAPESGLGGFSRRRSSAAAPAEPNLRPEDGLRRVSLPSTLKEADQEDPHNPEPSHGDELSSRDPRQPVPSPSSSIPQPRSPESEPQASAASPVKQPPPAEPRLSDLLSDLTIRENPTPSSPPVAPSLTPRPPAQSSQSGDVTPAAVPVPLSDKADTVQAGSTSAAPLVPAAQSRRQQVSGLVSTPQKLVSSIIGSNANAGGPVRQLAPDSDDEDEEAREADWARAMGVDDLGYDEAGHLVGEGQDVLGLFEQMRLGQEIMAEEEDEHEQDKL